MAGLPHPVSGLDHVLAMIAVGLWGAQLGAPALWLLPVDVSDGDGAGRNAGARSACRCPGVEIGIAVSAILLGLAVMSELRPPLAVAAVLVGFFASSTATPTAPSCRPEQSALLYSMGFVVATGCCTGWASRSVSSTAGPGGGSLLRAAGGGIALAGAIFMWRAVA